MRDGEDALVVPIYAVEALAAAIQRVIDEPDLRAAMTAKGFARYQNEFTKAKTVSQYLDYYHEMLKREGLTVTS